MNDNPYTAPNSLENARQRCRKTSWYYCLLFAALMLVNKKAATQDSLSTSVNDLKNLSIEELMNIEVTLVSRSPQKLVEAPSAVQVITGEQIRRSGAMNIADALRLVSNLQVAQLNASAWLIGSRGFNSIFSNKLLVMIDGRTVYTQLFAGVLWDMQNVLLDDVERIEVVSGPGGTLWGSNAVNGIINIITKSSKDTKGLYASVLAGTFVKDQAAIRWGGNIGDKISYKIYGQHFDRNPTQRPDGSDNSDAWRMTQGGFRMDWVGDEKNAYTVQGDYYGGRIKSAGKHSDFNGQNILGRWSHEISNESDIVLQLYYDRYIKADAPGLTSDEIRKFDVDFQYRFPVRKRHTIISGLGYRVVRDNFISTSSFLAILPAKKYVDLFNVFIQDQIILTRDVKLFVGTKLIHNVYSGFELQPGIRVSVSTGKNNTLWSAVSRAVRTPSRVDVDYYSPAEQPPPSTASVRGGPNFTSEKAYLFEAGYRLQPNTITALSIAAFYNVYNDVYSLEMVPGSLIYQAMNGTKGKSWGIEFSGTYQVLPSWRLKGGYTYIDMKLRAKPGHLFDPSYLANDVRNQVMLQSMTDLPFNLQLDIVARYMDYLPQTLVTRKVPSYFTFDTRLAYTIKTIEISVIGANLYKKKHIEFNSLSIPRSVSAKLAVRF